MKDSIDFTCVVGALTFVTLIELATNGTMSLDKVT